MSFKQGYKILFKSKSECMGRALDRAVKVILRMYPSQSGVPRSSPGYSTLIIVPWKAADNCSRMWIPDTYITDGAEFLAPDFSLAQQWLLQTSGEWISRGSLCFWNPNESKRNPLIFCNRSKPWGHVKRKTLVTGTTLMPLSWSNWSSQMNSNNNCTDVKEGLWGGRKRSCD